MAGFTMMSGAEFVAAMEAEGIEGSDDVVECQDCGASYVAGIDEHEPNNCVPVLRTTLARLTADLAAVTAERDSLRTVLTDAASEVARESAKRDARVTTLTAERDEALASATIERTAANEWLAQLHDARRERDEARGLLGRIGDWTHQFGAALCPTAGSADSFGDGMREAKRQVATIVAAHMGRGE